MLKEREYDIRAKEKPILLTLVVLKFIFALFLVSRFENFLNKADYLMKRIDYATKTAIAISSVSIASAEQKEENNHQR
jgi:hypothetical protein